MLSATTAASMLDSGESLKPSPSLPLADCRNPPDEPTVTAVPEVMQSASTNQSHPASGPPKNDEPATTPSSANDTPLPAVTGELDDTDALSGTESKDQVSGDQEASAEVDGGDDDGEDTGDSEFEVPADSRAEEDDDSIAADEDIADEEEVNSLMRESEMSLSELLAAYGLPAAAAAAAADSTPSVNGRPSRKRRQAAASEATEPSAVASPILVSEDVLDGVGAVKVQKASADHLEAKVISDVVASSAVADAQSLDPAATSAVQSAPNNATTQPTDTGLALEEEEDRTAHKGPDSVSGSTSDEYEQEDGEGKDDGAPGSYSPGLWCRALAAGDSPPAYNSDEDEDYSPNVEGDGNWRGEMRVGEEYQAVVSPQPLSSHLPGTDSHLGFDCRLLWRPGVLSNAEVERYQQAYAKTLAMPAPSSRTPDDDEALFLLMQSDFDTDEALQRLQFKPVHPTELPTYIEAWSEADCAAFERGFLTYNKNFRQIHLNKLRHKTVAELVQFYYLWKKTARHDDFLRFYRREKKKPLHPGITDFMDCLVQEQYSLSESLARTQSPDVNSNATANESASHGSPVGGVALNGTRLPVSTHHSSLPDFEATPVISLPKCTLPLDQSNSVRVSDLGVALQGLEDDPEVSISPRLRVVDPPPAVLNSSAVAIAPVTAPPAGGPVAVLRQQGLPLGTAATAPAPNVPQFVP
nr:unnamed protein product [Spirometra erinaceieuropaei]